MFNIIKIRNIFFLISWVLFLLSFFSIFWSKLNLWIDMTGGIQMEYNYLWEINTDEILEKSISISKSILHEWEEVINNVSVYKISWEDKFVVTAWFDNSLSDKILDFYKVDYRDKLTDTLLLKYTELSLAKYVNIWKSFWDYIKDTAIITLIIALVAISFYIAYAFSGAVSGISSFSFAIIAIITLFHDIIISTWFYVLSAMFSLEFKIDTFFVTALLTILGYSINDTIVVFDRIRSNLKILAWKKWETLENIVNISIKETLTRSIYTSLTLLFVLFTIFFFGPESVRGFVLVMIFGTIVGTYSSIFIASPLLFEINKNAVLKAYEENKKSPEDKIVV